MYLLGKKIEALNRLLKEPYKKEFYRIPDIRDIINKYLAEGELEEGSKKGMIKVDPNIHPLVGDIQQGQKEVKKEYIFKNINSNILPGYLLKLTDENTMVKESERLKFFKGAVPPVEIIS